MNPVAMAVVILSLTGAFLWSASQRWGLLKVGGPTQESRFGNLGKRLGRVWTFALFQKKMRYYLTAGVAHNLIFVGFSVLLLRTLILWGRGFDPSFNFWVFGPTDTAGQIYGFLKDVVSTLVVLGAMVFIYYRTLNKQKRMTLSVEGLVILCIIVTMMIADQIYDGAAIVLNHKLAAECGTRSSDWCGAAATIIKPFAPAAGPLAFHPYPEPAGSAWSLALSGVSVSGLVVIAHAGFWIHSSLVLIFLNILPYSKHFHIITAVPNVALSDITPPGRLPRIAKDAEELMAKVEKAMERDDMLAAPIGSARIEHFSWKDVLDFYTCTECGRCSDNCPAATTGKILSPKFLTLDLRNHLYSRQEEFLELGEVPRVNLDIAPAPATEPEAEAKPEAEEKPAPADASEAEKKPDYKPVDLIPNVVHEDVLWACTTCRACEEQCPVMITYVDKIVQMRRNLVMIRGESFPQELNKPFQGMETNGNPCLLYTSPSPRD